MKKSYLILMLSLIYLNSFSQNTFFISNKAYQSSEKWTFECESSIDRHPIVFVAKGINEGLFVISTETVFYYYIAGDLLIYLEDNTIIKCTDKKIRDEVNYKKTSVYKLTIAEVKKLANSRIVGVRFNLYDKHSDEKISFIAENSKDTFTNPFKTNSNSAIKLKPYHETDVEIMELFKL